MWGAIISAAMKTQSAIVGGIYASRAAKKAKKSITLKWNKASGAKTYTVYGAKYGKNKLKKIATVKKNSLKVTKAGKKLTKNRKYKFIVVAQDENNRVVSTSRLIAAKTRK